MNATRPARAGFTLIELLVVMTVVAVLMSTVLFALQGAAEQARVDRTRAQISKINDLLMERWEGYRQRPLPMRTVYPANTPRITIANDRLAGTWELMRMELPERLSDLQEPAYVLKAPNGSPLEPALWRAYRRKAEALTGVPWANITTQWTGVYSNAECLYLILSTIRDGDSNGLDFFSASEIGDTDNDGMPEILDGWGNPIMFLRWAPGFTVANGMQGTLQSGDGSAQPDPFDPLKVYRDTATNAHLHFALVPLIYSAGPDAQTDDSGNVMGYGINITNHNYADVSPTLGSYPPVRNYPYATLLPDPANAAGAAIQENGRTTHIDNITNQLQVVR